MTDQPQSLSVPPASRSRNPLGRSTWRSPPLAAWVRTRQVGRGLVTLLFLGLVAVFAWLVFRPLYHPNAQLAFMSGTDYHALEAPPAPFAFEDFEAMKGRNGVSPFLARLGGQTGPLVWRNLSSPGAMSGLAPQIADAVPDGNGVMMVYIDAHGVSDDGVPYLLCRNFDPANPAAGRYPLHDLLVQFRASSASVKLLILDSGRISCDPRLGMLVNEFPRLLKREVESTGDPNLWVLNSNAPFQRSHVSQSLERSVFSFFVVRGLRGAADLNDDHNIDLDELYRYVATNTAAWVRETSAGREIQTPVLYWGGGANWSQVEPPVLLPAPYDITAAVRPPALPGAPSSISTSNSPYASEVHSEVSPLAKAASKSATKKVPGAKAAKRTIKTGKKVSRAVEGPQQAGHAAGAQLPPSPAQPGANGAAPNGGQATGASAPAPTAESTAKPVTETAAGSGKSAPVANSSTTNSAAAGNPSAQAAQLLIDAWKWRDHSEAADDQPRPLDYAPQLWHEYQSWLLAEEHLDLAGGESDPSDIVDHLQKLLPRLQTLPRVAPLDEDLPPDLAARIASFAPHLPTGVDGPTSLAMAQLYAERGSQPLAPDIAGAIEAITRFGHEGSLDELTAWLAKLNPTLDRFAEVRVARALAVAAAVPTSGVNWPAVQLGLQAERLGQQVVAIDPALLPWIRSRVEAADRLRLAGERTLEDGIGADRRERGSSLLRQAIDLYQQAADDASIVAGAMQLRNDLLNRAPYYVEWYNPIVFAPSPDTPRPSDLGELLNHLSSLAAALDSADPTRLDEVHNLTAQMTPLIEQIENGLGDITVAAVSTRGTPGRLGRIESLLSTPLPNAEIRDSLLVAQSDADARMARGFEPPLVPGAVEPPPDVTPDQWRQVESRASLELALAKIAVGLNSEGAAGLANGGTGAAKSAAAQLVEPLDDAFKGLHSAVAAIGSEQSNSTGPSEQDGKAAEAVWLAARRFGAAVREFDRALPGQIESAVAANSDLSVRETRPLKLAIIRQCVRALRLIDARDVKQLGDIDPIGTLQNADMFDLLAWQEHRLDAAVADAPSGDGDYLADGARSYRLQAGQIAHEPSLDVHGAEPLEISGTSAVSLTTQPEAVADIVVHRTGAETAPVWFMIDYDPTMIDVVLPTTPVIYRQPVLQSSLSAAGPEADEQLPLRPDRMNLPSSLMMRAGDSEPIRLKVTAKPGARQSTRLIVKAISADAFLRHEIQVILPPPETLELTVDGTPGTWTPAETHLQLNPFPNRKTTYRLGLVNRSVTDRAVDVQLLAVEHPPVALPPATALSADDAATVLSRFGETAPIMAFEKIAVPAGGHSVALPFPMPKEKKPEEAAPPSGDEGASSGEGASAAPAQPPPLKSPLAHGLVVVISDRQTQLTTIRWIDIAPQRPRRFVHCKAAYDFDAGRLRIRVQPQDVSLLPPGKVHVHADLVPAPPAGTQTRLDGDLTPPDYEANLYADIVPDPGRTQTVNVAIDGYPRAFVFRVPLGLASPDVPESTDLREVHILAPISGAAYKAPIESLPVDFEVNSPIGAFDNPDDVLELGIDPSRQRDLRGDRTVRLTTDRQVAIGIDSVLPGGLMTIESRVGDFHQFPVPVPGLRNARVDLLGRIFAGGKSGYSEAVEIILDGSPPVIERVELRPQQVVIGPKDEEVSVWASDEGLSGVSKIEAAFDPLGTGHFGGLAPAVLMDRNTSGYWTTKLPTKLLNPGDITLLVRATDAVGNESDYKKIKCHVITLDQAKLESETVRLIGTAFFGTDPLPGAKLSLAGDPNAKIPPVVADDHGNFTFPAVPPGKYKLTAQGLIHNKNRKADEDITVAAGPNPPPVKITLK